MAGRLKPSTLFNVVGVFLLFFFIVEMNAVFSLSFSEYIEFNKCQWKHLFY